MGANFGTYQVVSRRNLLTSYVHTIHQNDMTNVFGFYYDYNILRLAYRLWVLITWRELVEKTCDFQLAKFVRVGNGVGYDESHLKDATVGFKYEVQRWTGKDLALCYIIGLKAGFCFTQ